MRCFSFDGMGGGLVVGTKELNYEIAADWTAYVVAADKDAVGKLATRSIGEFVSQGRFAFRTDPIAGCMQNRDVRGNGEKQPAFDTMGYVARRLGPISVRGYTLYFSGDKLVGFWIETAEGERERVLSSDVDKTGTFEGMPSGFAFTPSWVSAAIIAQH